MPELKVLDEVERFAGKQKLKGAFLMQVK